MKTQRRRLFRNEECFGSGERDIFQVIWHEVASLWNTDIFKYCLNHYRLSDSLSGTLNLDISIIEEFGERPEDLDEDIKNLVSELSSLTGKQLKFVLWLAEKDAVRTLYQGTEENMSCYEASDVILSDLGLDGILFAYEQPPQPTIIS